MATLPQKPRRGQTLDQANLPEVIGRLIDYCRSITPRTSPTVRVSSTAAGATFTAIRNPNRSSGGGAVDLADSAFKISAILEVAGDPPVAADPPTFTVTMFGGPCQVLGGEEHIYDDIGKDEEVEGVPDGAYVWARYKLWDDVGAAVCAWDAAPHITVEKPPVETSSPKSLVFLIGRIGSAYRDYVRQDRTGAIQAIATLNASPDFDDIVEAPAP